MSYSPNFHKTAIKDQKFGHLVNEEARNFIWTKNRVCEVHTKWTSSCTPCSMSIEKFPYFISCDFRATLGWSMFLIHQNFVVLTVFSEACCRKQTTCVSRLRVEVYYSDKLKFEQPSVRLSLDAAHPGGKPHMSRTKKLRECLPKFGRERPSFSIWEF